MKIRQRRLSGGWYPETAAGLLRQCEAWALPPPLAGAGALAALAPHAGFAFSGRLAALAWSRLGPAETVAVIGGHLGAKSPLLYAEEEAFQGPMGLLHADGELRDCLLDLLSRRGLEARPDREGDNSVEIQLPLMGLYAPSSRLLWLRAPAGPAALALGAALAEAARHLDRSLVVLASSDLTHYGPDYGFEPLARPAEAPAWVREKNDRGLLDACLALDPQAVLERAAADRSACSAGALAAALSFAKLGGDLSCRELGYATSLDLRQSPSFVGYAALGFYT